MQAIKEARKCRQKHDNLACVNILCKVTPTTDEEKILYYDEMYLSCYYLGNFTGAYTAVRDFLLMCRTSPTLASAVLSEYSRYNDSWGYIVEHMPKLKYDVGILAPFHIPLDSPLLKIMDSCSDSISMMVYTPTPRSLYNMPISNPRFTFHTDIDADHDMMIVINDTSKLALLRSRYKVLYYVPPVKYDADSFNSKAVANVDGYIFLSQAHADEYTKHGDIKSCILSKDSMLMLLNRHILCVGVLDGAGSMLGFIQMMLLNTYPSKFIRTCVGASRPQDIIFFSDDVAAGKQTSNRDLMDVKRVYISRDARPKLRENKYHISISSDIKYSDTQFYLPAYLLALYATGFDISVLERVDRKIAAKSHKYCMAKVDETTANAFSKIDNVTTLPAFTNSSAYVAKLREYKYCLIADPNVPGYISEHIIFALMADCIPIYIGNIDIEKHFNTACFINANNLSVAQVLSKVESIEADERKYRDYMNSPILTEFARQLNNDALTVIATGLRRLIR